MATVQRSILVEAPAADSLAFWADADNFHNFMEGVERVTRIGPSDLRWRAQTQDGLREWNASLTVDEGARTLGWTHADGHERSMTITFAPLEGNSCWVVCTVEIHTEGIDGDLADVLGRTSRRLERDMRAARDRIEERYQSSKRSNATQRGSSDSR